jgi:hypothetical protein
MHVADMSAVNALIWAYIPKAIEDAYKSGAFATDTTHEDLRGRPVLAVWLFVHHAFLREVSSMLEPGQSDEQRANHVYPLRSSVQWQLPELISELQKLSIPFLLQYQRLGDNVHVPTGNPHAGAHERQYVSLWIFAELESIDQSSGQRCMLCMMPL